MGNTEKQETKKCRRKIRIRLADPNNPDSYICEVLDSSLENDDDFSEDIHRTKDSVKPKNYFDLLMSKKSKKTNEISSIKDNEVSLVKADDSFYKKRQKNKKKSVQVLTQSVDAKSNESVCEIDSSEDESLFQVQQNYKMKILNSKQYGGFENGIKNENSVTLIESTKIELSQKNTLGILNYFSKTETSLNIKKPKDLVEITTVQKTCLSSDNSNKKETQNGKKNFFNTVNKENVKLAPLFQKKEPKVIDLDRQKARLEFLYKGSPTIVKKSENKNSEVIDYFPVVYHVQQRNDDLCWSIREVPLPLPVVSTSKDFSFSVGKKFCFEIKTTNIVSEAISDDKIKLNKELFNEIKCKYVDLDIESIIKGLKDKKDKFLAQTKQTKKLKDLPSSDASLDELNTLWTEKYKPKSNEIIGNASVVKSLKKWLNSWKSFDEELKLLVKSNQAAKNKESSDEDYDSDDFLDPNRENYGLKVPGNVCIISGPNGCGKTSLVYAVANELEFSVLELNASSKRTGKKVMTDLQEATRSHKVHRVNLPLPKEKETKPRRSKKRKNGKISNPVKKAEPISDCKISLILIEDADIVFDDHDEGFFSAISSLIQTSKRPMVFLTNESNCLETFKTDQCLVLEMEPPNFYQSCALLDVVSILEGVKVNKELLEALLRENSFDLRKSLLELQFWIHSGKKLPNSRKQFDLGQLWWGLSKFLYKQDIRHFVKPRGCKRKRDNDLFDSSFEIEEDETTTKKFKSETGNVKIEVPIKIDVPKKWDPLTDSYHLVLDSVSVLDGFGMTRSQEPLPGFECLPKDSLSLDERMEDVSWTKYSLDEIISEELVTLSERIFAEKVKQKEGNDRKLNFVSPCWEEIRWRNSQEKASEELSELVSTHRGRDKRSLHLDYLPILRNICRAERNRSEMNPKRKNRFYHYLNNLGGREFSDENLEINCEVFDRCGTAYSVP